jgi:hypothetical protein
MDDMVEGWTIMQDGTETPARRGRQFSVTLPDALMDELRIYAARKALAPATLARQWLAERLEMERKGGSDRAQDAS